MGGRQIPWEEQGRRGREGACDYSKETVTGSLKDEHKQKQGQNRETSERPNLGGRG